MLDLARIWLACLAFVMLVNVVGVFVMIGKPRLPISRGAAASGAFLSGITILAIVTVLTQPR